MPSLTLTSALTLASAYPLSTSTSASTLLFPLSALTSTSAFIDGRVGYLAASDVAALSDRLDQVHTELNRVISSLRRSSK